MPTNTSWPSSAGETGVVNSSRSWSAEAVAEVAGGCALNTASAGYHRTLHPAAAVYTWGECTGTGPKGAKQPSEVHGLAGGGGVTRAITTSTAVSAPRPAIRA